MRISTKIKALLALGLVTILALAGCAKSTSAPTPMSTKGPSGDLKVVLSGFGDERLDPIKSGGIDRFNLLSPMFDSLLRTDGVNPTPALAEKWEMTPDGLSWTFYLRKGIKFHNGDEMTATDVKFSLDRYITSDAQYSDLRGMVDHTDIVDNYTVRVYTKGKQPFLTYIIYPPVRGQSLIMPKSYFEQVGAKEFEAHPIGTGPYKFVNHIAGDSVSMEALTSHWRVAPVFKNLTVIKIPDGSTRVAMLKTGAADISEVGASDTAELESLGYKTASLSTEMAVINLHGAYAPQSVGKPMADIRVRQALSLAINRDEMIKMFFFNKATFPIAPYIYDVSADVDIPYWRDYGAKLYRYDPTEAKKLLTDAGYPQGIDLKFWSYSMSGATDLPKMAEVIQGYWLKIGVKAQIVAVDNAAYKAVQNELKTPEIAGQVAVFSTGASSLAAQRLTGGYSTSGTFGLLNKAFPEIDKTLSSVMSEMDASKRKEMLTGVIKTIADSYTQLPIAYAQMLVALGPNVNITFPKPVDCPIGYYLDLAQHGK
jgi:peptide/nickel transport system substrate-binding protein